MHNAFMRILFFYIFSFFLLNNSFSVEVWHEPTGDYATIEVKHSNECADILIGENAETSLKEKTALEIEKKPGSFHPFTLMALACYHTSNKNFEKAAFWARASILRASADLKMYPDPSLEDVIPTMFALLHKNINKHFTKPDDLKKWKQSLQAASKKIVPWDVSTPRNYDDRWACLHSIGAFTGKKIKLLSQEEKNKIIKEERELFEEAIKTEPGI